MNVWRSQSMPRHRLHAAATAATAPPTSFLSPPAEAGISRRPQQWAAVPAKPYGASGRPAAATPSPTLKAAGASRHAAAVPRAGAATPAAAKGPDPLRSICLGVLAEHLEDLLADAYCCEHILPYLPSEAKACLLAVARLRRLLCDAALLLLADEGQTTLDLHGCGEAVSESGIEAALRRMPHLRQVGGWAGLWSPLRAGCSPWLVGCSPLLVGCSPLLVGCSPWLAGCSPWLAAGLGAVTTSRRCTPQRQSRVCVDPTCCQVDLTSCSVGAGTLRVLGECCPAVEQLRLGSRLTDETAGK